MASKCNCLVTWNSFAPGHQHPNSHVDRVLTMTSAALKRDNFFGSQLFSSYIYIYDFMWLYFAKVWWCIRHLLKQIYSWGANHEGQLGTGDKIAKPKPTLIPWQPEDDAQIVQVACNKSTHHSKVLTYRLVRFIMLLHLSTYRGFIILNYKGLVITEEWK